MCRGRVGLNALQLRHIGLQRRRVADRQQAVDAAQEHLPQLIRLERGFVEDQIIQGRQCVTSLVDGDDMIRILSELFVQPLKIFELLGLLGQRRRGRGRHDRGQRQWDHRCCHVHTSSRDSSCSALLSGMLPSDGRLRREVEHRITRKGRRRVLTVPRDGGAIGVGRAGMSSAAWAAGRKR